MIRVLGRTSSINVRKVLWTLKEIGADFEHESDWGGDFKSTEDSGFLSMNPNGLVPVLVDEEGVLWESNTICRYLASKHKRYDLLPDTPRRRADVEKWMDWVATEYNTAYRYAFMALSRKHKSYVIESEINSSVMLWNKITMIFDQQLQSGGPYINGEVFTLADILLGLSVNRWIKTPIEHAVCPAVTAYLERLKLRTALAGTNYLEIA